MHAAAGRDDGATFVMPQEALPRKEMQTVLLNSVLPVSWFLNATWHADQGVGHRRTVLGYTSTFTESQTGDLSGYYKAKVTLAACCKSLA